MAVPPPAAANPQQLPARVPVDLRDADALSALSDWAAGTGLTLHVTPATQRRLSGRAITLRAESLTRLDAMSWIARLGGARCVIAGDRILIANPSEIPALWRVADQRMRLILAGAASTTSESRKARLGAEDVSVSRFADMIRDAFGIGVVLTDPARRSQMLVRFDEADRDLQATLLAATGTTALRCRRLDGLVLIDVSPSDLWDSAYDAPLGPEFRSGLESGPRASASGGHRARTPVRLVDTGLNELWTDGPKTEVESAIRLLTAADIAPSQGDADKKSGAVPESR
jgi:hypothetical protein